MYGSYILYGISKGIVEVQHIILKDMIFTQHWNSKSSQILYYKYVFLNVPWSRCAAWRQQAILWSDGDFHQ